MKTMPVPTGRTRWAFLFGHPVTHSFSPAMHNAAFSAIRIDLAYGALDLPPEGTGTAVELLRSESVIGANVTVPYKEAVLPHLDEIDAEAKWLRSVNTLYKRGKKVVGTSTDGAGFVRSLGRDVRALQGAAGLLIGAGGAARAVAGALRKTGLRQLLVSDLAEDRVKSLVRLLRKAGSRMEAVGVSRQEAEGSLSRLALVVQATPLGLHPGDPSPLQLTSARPGTLAVDLIYHRKTPFLRQAAARGLKPRDGLGMLLHQGALSFELWTGRKAPIPVMEAALRKALGR